jgi:glycosyltransferase involved in cell wall biosynthesis
VDNSSYDAIGPIKEKLMSHGNVVLLYSGIAKGAGHARNVGLEHASGKWLLFLDADDFYLPKAFEEIDHWKETSYDMVYFKSTSMDLETGSKGQRHRPNNCLVDNFLNGKAHGDEYLRYSYLEPWGKLFRAEMILANGIFFEELCCSVDVKFSLLASHQARKINASCKAVYSINHHTSNISRLTDFEHKKINFLVNVQRVLFLKYIGVHHYHTRFFSLLIGILISNPVFFFKAVWILIQTGPNLTRELVSYFKNSLKSD